MAGQKSEKFWADAVRRAVNRRMENVEGRPKKLEALADKLVAAGLNGEIAALKEIGDRIDGRPTMAVDHSSTDGTMSPVNMTEDQAKSRADELIAKRDGNEPANR